MQFALEGNRSVDWVGSPDQRHQELGQSSNYLHAHRPRVEPVELKGLCRENSLLLRIVEHFELSRLARQNGSGLIRLSFVCLLFCKTILFIPIVCFFIVNIVGFKPIEIRKLTDTFRDLLTE